MGKQKSNQCLTCISLGIAPKVKDLNEDWWYMQAARLASLKGREGSNTVHVAKGTRAERLKEHRDKQYPVLTYGLQPVPSQQLLRE